MLPPAKLPQAICAFPGVSHANVYGVAVPDTEGRVGMAALVAEDESRPGRSPQASWRALPAYARPVFLRIRSAFDVTGTFKYSKTELIRQGYDPRSSGDALYFDSLESEAFVSARQRILRSHSVRRDSILDWKADVKAELTSRATIFHRSQKRDAYAFRSNSR